MNLNELIKLIQVVEATGFAEFDYQTPDLKMVLRRHIHTPHGQIPESEPAIAAPLSVPPSPPTADGEAELVEVLAPMVGTFYRAPSPEAEPFASPGTKVKPGDTLCILEAMKLMNEIEAEISGEVVAVIPENGQLVEFGQVLMTLRPVQP